MHVLRRSQRNNKTNFISKFSPSNTICLINGNPDSQTDRPNNCSYCRQYHIWKGIFRYFIHLDERFWKQMIMFFFVFEEALLRYNVKSYWKLQITQKYIHFRIDFCSSYAGFLNASSKNQMLFTAQMNGSNAKPTMKNNEFNLKSFIRNFCWNFLLEFFFNKINFFQNTSEIPFA